MKTRAELLAAAEALEWAFRSNPYGYMKPLPEVNARIAELRNQAEAMPTQPDLSARVAELEGLLRRVVVQRNKLSQSDHRLDSDIDAALAKEI